MDWNVVNVYRAFRILVMGGHASYTFWVPWVAVGFSISGLAGGGVGGFPKLSQKSLSRMLVIVMFCSLVVHLSPCPNYCAPTKIHGPITLIIFLRLCVSVDWCQNDLLQGVMLETCFMP